ncbi:MAG: molybdopterin molybdenumtransferase MoeA [Flammeovirgaceae bacterium TMED32]|nr:MAG: molybdopterin molybdenumtransferase MoeA [Flammeovirgaceae bacterium TMED32]
MFILKTNPEGSQEIGVRIKPLMKVDEAKERILRSMPVMPGEEISITEALGRVTSCNIYSRRTQPPAALSAMDGYAIRFSDITDIPSEFIRVGSAKAGGSYPGTLNQNETVRIFTGAPVPTGADTIVIQENVDAENENDGTHVVVRERPQKGRYIRSLGLDFNKGELGIQEGKKLTSRDIGLAAAMNIPWLSVSRRPKIAILATGDEIIRPGESINKDQIVSSNSYTLSALVKAAGGEPIILGIAPDTIDGIQSFFKNKVGADLIITTGGASVGEHDLIQKALGKESFGEDGLDLDFWRIAMRPGKPLIFGQINNTPILGLPGNPVSTMVCGAVFVRPAIDKMLGIYSDQKSEAKALLAEPVPENDERQDYIRAITFINKEGIKVVKAFDHQDSSMMKVLAQANCLIIRPPFDSKRSIGDEVKLIEFKDGF